MDKITEMLKGSLEGCVMEIVSRNATYGYEITRQLNMLGFSDVVDGTVYAILARLERCDLVDVVKKPSKMGPPRKFYTLNTRGYEELSLFWTKWDFVSSKISSLRENSNC